MKFKKLKWRAIFSAGCFAGVKNKEGDGGIENYDIAEYLKERQVDPDRRFEKITTSQDGSYPFCVNGDYKPSFPINGSTRPSAQSLVIALENGEIQVGVVKHIHRWIASGDASWLEAKVRKIK